MACIKCDSLYRQDVYQVWHTKQALLVGGMTYYTGVTGHQYGLRHRHGLAHLTKSSFFIDNKCRMILDMWPEPISTSVYELMI